MMRPTMGTAITTPERDRLVRRNTVLLAFAQGFVQMSFPVLLVIGGPASRDITGREVSAGVLWGVYFLLAATRSRGDRSVDGPGGTTAGPAARLRLRGPRSGIAAALSILPWAIVPLGAVGAIACVLGVALAALVAVARFGVVRLREPSPAGVPTGLR